jgi:bifunctional non-homologous end joining protein LigD
MISSMVGIFALLGDPSDLFQSVTGLLQRADGEIVAHSQSIICRACHNFPHEVRYNDLTHRFPLIVETLARLRSRSCIIDREAVACDDNGVASFDLVRHQRANDKIFLYAFDLIELNGDDLRRDPLEVRKATLASIVAKASPGIRLNEHMEGDGPTVFAHACKLGLEGIVSKRKDSAYRSGRSPDWLKMKNANAPAVKREAEEDWAR